MRCRPHSEGCALHPVPAEQTPNGFKCDFCDFSTSLPNGLKVHIGVKHKEHQKPEVLPKESGKSSKETLDHVRKEHNRTAHILSRENGKNHCYFVNEDEVFCSSMCTGENNIVSLQTC